MAAGCMWPTATTAPSRASTRQAARWSRPPPVGTHPFGLALDRSGRRLYSADVISNTVTVLDADSLQVIATVHVGNTPYCLALTADGARLFVTNQHAGTVSVIDTASLRVIQTLTKGLDYPEGILVTPDDRRIMVANWFQ